jgi:hypothetical protein
MSDVAFQNAKALRARLLKDLARVDTFIANYRAYASGGTPTVTWRERRGHPRGSPKIVAGGIVSVFTRLGRPLRQDEIVAALKDDGVTIPSKPGLEKMYVNTILWRNSHQFTHHPDGTYTLSAMSESEPHSSSVAP